MADTDKIQCGAFLPDGVRCPKDATERLYVRDKRDGRIGTMDCCDQHAIEFYASQASKA